MQFDILTKEQLFKKLEAYDPEFDSNESLRLGYNNLGIITHEGEFIRCASFVDFCTNWNRRFKDILEVSTTKDSFRSGKLFYIKWKQDLSKATPKVEKVDVETSQEAPLEDVQPLISLEVDTPTTEDKPPVKTSRRSRKA